MGCRMKEGVSEPIRTTQNFTLESLTCVVQQTGEPKGNSIAHAQPGRQDQTGNRSMVSEPSCRLLDGEQHANAQGTNHPRENDNMTNSQVLIEKAFLCEKTDYMTDHNSKHFLFAIVNLTVSHVCLFTYTCVYEDAYLYIYVHMNIISCSAYIQIRPFTKTREDTHTHISICFKTTDHYT